MKKILFVCNYFSPDATIAAIRTTKLVKYLKKSGYEVDFLACKNDSLSEDEILANDISSVEVTYAHNSKKFLNADKRWKKLLEPIKKKKLADMSNRERVNPKTGHIEFYPYETAYPFLGSIEYISNIKKQKDYFKSVKKWLETADAYDYLITSYGDAFSYYAGKYYHKLHPETKWVFDIRDAIYRYKFTPCYVSFIPKIMEKRVWKEADVITGISQGICDRVPEKYSSKVHKLTNGYDISDRENIIPEALSGKEALTMTFTGSMYGGLQKLTPLFKAIRELINNGELEKDFIQYHFAGTESAKNVFLIQLKEYDLENQMINHGKLDRKATLKLQCSSDVLLAPSYDFEINKGGVITGKFFEYMSAKRPMIVVVTGDIETSEIGQITRECNLGAVYEEAHHNTDYELLKAYVLKICQKKRITGEIPCELRIENVEQYDYRNITQELVKILQMEG